MLNEKQNPYILVEVVEREIHIFSYKTEKEALADMKLRLYEVLQIDALDEEEKEKRFREYVQNGICELGETTAWANVNNPGDCDWAVFEVESK